MWWCIIKPRGAGLCYTIYRVLPTTSKNYNIIKLTIYYTPFLGVCQEGGILL